MNESPVFNIGFVKAVQKHPCLWNYTLPEYIKRSAIEEAWTQVSREVNDSDIDCRRRWRNIRGAFMRYRKNIGTKEAPKKKYYLNNYLQFLLPYINRKPSRPNIVEDQINDFDDTNSEFDLIEGDEHENQEIRMSDYSLDMTDTLESIKEESIDIINKFENRNVEPPSTTSNVVSSDPPEWKTANSKGQEDANVLFLRSLLPDISKMTAKQNRRFRQKVIGLIDDILDDADIGQV